MNYWADNFECDAPVRKIADPVVAIRMLGCFLANADSRKEVLSLIDIG